MKGRWPFHWMYGAFLREAGLALSMPEDDAPGIKRGFNDQGLAIANSNWHAEEPVSEPITSAQMPAVWGLTQRERAIVYSALQWVADDPHWARETLSKIPQEPVGFPGVTLAEFNELVRKFE